MGITSKQYNGIVICIILALIYWVFIGLIWSKDLSEGLGRINDINATSAILVSQNSLKEGGLPLILGNSVISVSIPNFVKPQTLASIIRIEKEAELIIECESTNEHDKWGDTDYVYPAYGIAQFQERTFYWLAGLAEKELNWKSEQHQRWLLKWAIENNYGYLWTCWKTLDK